MLPLPELDASLQQDLLLLLPIIATDLLIWLRKPRKRLATGLFLGFMWNFATLVPLNNVAMYFHFWSFSPVKNVFLNLPLDVMLGWSLFWGVVIPLFFRQKSFLLSVILVVMIDVATMPNLKPLITLNHTWWLGEIMVILLCFMPGSWIVMATTKDIFVRWRGLMQAIITAFILLILMPAMALLHQHQQLADIFQNTTLSLLGISAGLLIAFILGLSANQEFAERGLGTPIPFDPPKKLVVSGPYAYVRNPMQLSAFLILCVLAIAYKSLEMAGVAGMAVIYCLGIVRQHHKIDLEPRFGQQWITYKKQVRAWLPTWRPWIKEPATLYLHKKSYFCKKIKKWLTRVKPIHLKIVMIEKQDKITYLYAGGGETKGVRALASALNHVNLVWAFLGWGIGLL